MEEVVSKHSVVMDEYDPRKRVGMFVDEWGIWTDVEPGTNPGFLFQQNSMRDALIASTTLDIFNRHADRVKMANIAQMVNVLQSMILTEGDQMVLTPTYHVFNMYKVHGGATLLPANLFTEKYVYGNNALPAISQTVSRDESGKIHVSLSNIDPAREMKITVEFYGKQGVKVNGGTLLTAPAFNSFNAFNKPAVVKPVTFKNYKLTSPNVLEVTLPSKSVVTLEME